MTVREVVTAYGIGLIANAGDTADNSMPTLQEGRIRQMDLGFDTIGNATLHPLRPRTGPGDRSLGLGSAYFWIWGLSHAVPEQQLDAIERSEFVWISHGPPDHLNAASDRSAPSVPLPLGRGWGDDPHRRSESARTLRAGHDSADSARDKTA